jgi:hypothetical protein
MLNYLQAEYLLLRDYVLSAPPRSLLMIFGLPAVGILSLFWLIATSPAMKTRRPTPQPSEETAATAPAADTFIAPSDESAGE